MTGPAWPGPLAGPCHLVLPRDGARVMVVFFGARDLAPGQFNYPQLGRDLPATAVWLNNGANDWYQQGIPDIADTASGVTGWLSAMAAAAGADRLALVGTSMGAWGALAQGAALAAAGHKVDVLAFSCDAGIGAPLSQSAAHYTGPRPPPQPALGPVLAGTAARITLMAGEAAPGDLAAAAELAATGGLTVHSVIGAGHYLPTYLSRRGRLTPLLRGLVAGRPLPRPEDAGTALTAPGHLAALVAAARAEAAGDWPRAEAEARAALAAYPGEAAEAILGWALVNLNRPAEAIDPLARALAACPDDPARMQILATALRRAGALARARALFSRALAADPGLDAAQYGLALVHQAEGDIPAARAAIARALKIAPGNAAYRKRAADLAARARPTRSDPM